MEEAKLLIRELLREEALERVHVAMEEEDFDVLIKSIQVKKAERYVVPFPPCHKVEIHVAISKVCVFCLLMCFLF